MDIIVLESGERIPAKGRSEIREKESHERKAGGRIAKWLFLGILAILCFPYPIVRCTHELFERAYGEGDVGGAICGIVHIAAIVGSATLYGICVCVGLSLYTGVVI